MHAEKCPVCGGSGVEFTYQGIIPCGCCNGKRIVYVPNDPSEIAVIHDNEVHWHVNWVKDDEPTGVNGMAVNIPTNVEKEPGWYSGW